MNQVSQHQVRQLPPEWGDLTRRIIGCAINVHRELGPGLLESLYEEAMCVELAEHGLLFRRQQPIQIRYRDKPIGDLRVDLIVEDLVIVELKAIERVIDAHRAQLLSYLRSTDLPLGLLINFNHDSLTAGVTRRLNERSSRMANLPAVMTPAIQSDSSTLSPSELSASSEFLPLVRSPARRDPA